MEHKSRDSKPPHPKNWTCWGARRQSHEGGRSEVTLTCQVIFVFSYDLATHGHLPMFNAQSGPLTVTRLIAHKSKMNAKCALSGNRQKTFLVIFYVFSVFLYQVETRSKSFLRRVFFYLLSQ
eukprot:GEMP01130188.1.p1 GENE.GEMP01130188.1~~GEMP01130188.1.p1  ORF type:complete len:122 (+),score=11.40 GEMP01130188.1:127-492(+)